MARPTFEEQLAWYSYGSYRDDGSEATSLGSYPRYRRTYSGTVTPQYYDHRQEYIRKILRLPYNLYQMTVERTMSTRVSWKWWNPDDTPLVYHGTIQTAANIAGYNSFDDQPSSLVQDVKNRAFMRLGKQASAVKVNLAQFFGERRQTANLLADTARRIASAASALKHADLRTFQKALSLSGAQTRTVTQSWKRVQDTPINHRVANHWLEYVYGWKPLLSDLYAGAEYLASRMHDPPKTSGLVEASASKNVQVSIPIIRNGSGAIRVARLSTHKVGVKAAMLYTLQSEARSVLAQTGISNPLLLAWELLPYSFVVDWFLPVGNYLESLTTFDGFDMTAGYVTTLESSTSARDVYFDQDYSYPTKWVFEDGRVTLAACRLHRTTETLDYVPVLKSPIGGEPLSRFLTASALLTNIFRDPLKPLRR